MTPEQIEQVLYEHRDALTCYDHPESYCCPCGEHEVSSWRVHVAQVLASLMPQATETTS